MIDEIPVLCIELEDPPSRIDLPATGAFEKDAGPAFSDQFIGAALSRFNEGVAHPHKRRFAGHRPGIPGMAVPDRSERLP